MLTAKAQSIVPILINLRDYRTATNLKQVITDTLVNHYGIRLNSFLAFERICGLGMVLLVLDGFDEMAGRSDRDAVLESFQQIYLLAALNTKILLTCRSNFFKSTSDVIALLKHYSINVPLSEEPSAPVIQLDLSAHGRIVTVQKLSPDQVRQFIRKRFGEQSDDVFDTISNIHDLSDLATRPVLLDMILTTLPELRDKDIRVNSAALYEHYTNKWSARDQWRVSTPLAVRQQFCDTLAWAMHRYGLDEVEYPVLREAMILSIGGAASSEDELERFMDDIQTCSFLVRSGKNDSFRFAHKSFLEFLVAKRLVGDLLKGTLPDKPLVADPRKSRPDDSQWLRVSQLDLDNYFSARVMHLYHGKSGLLSAREVLRGVLLADKGAQEVVGGGKRMSAETLTAQIESSVLSLFAKLGARSVEEVGLSEEIATFALEDIENRGISVHELIRGLGTAPLKELFSDIVRLSKSLSFVDRNRQLVREQAATTDDKILRSVFCAVLARIPGAIDDDFVRRIRERMPADEWTYFLFELSRNGDSNKTLLASVVAGGDLRPVDRILCSWGLGVLEKADSRVVEGAVGALGAAAIVESLLRSDDAKEIELGIALCGFVDIGESRLADLMFDFVGRATDRDVKARAIDQIGLLSTEQSWRRIRVLASQEKHADVRREFDRAEKRIRDNLSLKRNRRSWRAAKNDRRLQEQMWKLLK